jgi:thiol-disulfide isomerase/thioredoxin
MSVRWVVVLVGFLALVAAVFALGAGGEAGIGKPAPEISGSTWINSPPLRLADLKGKVVLVEFWTLGCYNCRNVEPYVKAWHAKFADQGLVVVGVHTPETERERDIKTVRSYVAERGIRYPVAVDEGFATWERYGNRYWPALYLIDKKGTIRLVQIGEGGYEKTEARIAELLASGG